VPRGVLIVHSPQRIYHLKPAAPKAVKHTSRNFGRLRFPLIKAGVSRLLSAVARLAVCLSALRRKRHRLFQSTNVAIVLETGHSWRTALVLTANSGVDIRHTDGAQFYSFQLQTSPLQTFSFNPPKQRFPTLYLCEPEVTNGMWPAALPWERQQSVIFTVKDLTLMPFLEHYMTLPLIKKILRF
jgi:hypothetical protein